MSTVFTVYGKRSSGLILPGQTKVGSAGVHADRLPTLEMAQQFLMKVLMKYPGTVDAVIVALENGQDFPATRSVVHRVGRGKAWWE